MHQNLWCFPVVMILVKVRVHWSLLTYACWEAQPQNWLPSISFCSIKYQYHAIDVSIWMSLGAFVCACALIATVCINCCEQNYWLCLHTSICMFFFSEVGGGKGASKIKNVNKPEDHWSCIAHLSAEDMLKSAVIEEKKFKHSPWSGADNP